MCMRKSTTRYDDTINHMMDICMFIVCMAFVSNYTRQEATTATSSLTHVTTLVVMGVVMLPSITAWSKTCFVVSTIVSAFAVHAIDDNKKSVLWCWAPVSIAACCVLGCTVKQDRMERLIYRQIRRPISARPPPSCDDTPSSLRPCSTNETTLLQRVVDRVKGGVHLCMWVAIKSAASVSRGTGITQFHIIEVVPLLLICVSCRDTTTAIYASLPVVTCLSVSGFTSATDPVHFLIPVAMGTIVITVLLAFVPSRASIQTVNTASSRTSAPYSIGKTPMFMHKFFLARWIRKDGIKRSVDCVDQAVARTRIGGIQSVNLFLAWATVSHCAGTVISVGMRQHGMRYTLHMCVWYIVVVFDCVLLIAGWRIASPPTVVDLSTHLKASRACIDLILMPALAFQMHAHMLSVF